MNRHSTRVKIAGTDLEISRLGLGTAPLGGMYTPVAEGEAEELIRFALAKGINFFDTAPFYGAGLSEIRLGRELRNAGMPYIIETKVGRVLNPAKHPNIAVFVEGIPGLEPVFDLSADGIKRSIEESLTRLDVDHIDIALIHDAEDHMDQAISEAYPVLDDLRRQGVIKGVGTGMNYCDKTIRFIHECELNVVLIAGRYTLLDQEAEIALLPLALEKGISVLVGGVFNSGILANPSSEATYNYEKVPTEILSKAELIKAFLAQRGVSLIAAAIQFPLQHPGVSAVLTGAKSRYELEVNIANFDQEIPSNIWSDLRAEGLIN